MKNEAWPTFSFTELLSPPEGWRTDCAILSTYSADLVVIVTALLALTGCDLDSRRTGSRVELVKAIEALRGRVCVLAQTGRVAIPNTFRPILKLLDKFGQEYTCLAHCGGVRFFHELCADSGLFLKLTTEPTTYSQTISGRSNTRGGM